jgi:radical SAM superfamily enzyme YgiQ (UPF0313 family)
MKVLFVNAPVIRSAASSPENGFAVSGFVFRREYQRVPGAWYVYRALHRMGLGQGVRYGVRAGSRWPWTAPHPCGAVHFPFTMAYATSYLRANGVDATLIDAVAEQEYSYEAFLARVRDAQADLVVVECSTPTIDLDGWIATRIAAFAEVALAGPHLTGATVGEVARQFPRVRYLLQGEYILSVLRLVRERRPGVYESEVVRELDALPPPSRGHRAASEYFDPSMPTPRPQLQIWASKGCPFKCTFCLWPQTMYGGRVSLRAPEKVAAEIRAAVAEHGYRSVFFDDDTFNLGTERVSRLCNELKAIGLPWTMMGRLDCSPDWLYDKMADSGCVGMRFGIESFDLEVLRNIEKGIERVDFRKTLEVITRRHPRLMIHLTMMKDLPGQTAESHAEDMAILAGLGYSTDDPSRSYQLAACAPFPGTKLHAQLVERFGADAVRDYRRYDGGADTVMSQLASPGKPRGGA